VVFQGKNGEQASVWTPVLPSLLLNCRALPLGRGEVGSLSKQALLEETGTFQRLAGIILLFMAFNTC